MNTIINVADIIDQNDPEERTWREINKEMTHNIPIGTLVELETGIRAFVVHHSRDCDETPLYELCYDKDDVHKERDGFRNFKWFGGYIEEDLKIVKPGPTIDMEYLLKLSKPEEAISKDLWDHWRNILLSKPQTDENWKKILNSPIRDIGIVLGLIWESNTDMNFIDILLKPIDKIKSSSLIEKESRSNCIRTVSGAMYLSHQDIENIISGNIDYRSAISSENLIKYKESQLQITKTLVKAREKLTNENYEEIMKEIYGKIISNALNISPTKTDTSKIVKSIFYRYFEGKTIEETAKALEIHSPMVVSYCNRIVKSFKQLIINTDSDMRSMCKSVDKLRDISFEILDRTDIDKRNERLNIIHRFRDTFLERPNDLYA